MRRPIRNVREWSSDPRSIALITLGLVYIRVTVVYLPWVLPYRTSPLPLPLESLPVPLWVYGIMWAVTGASTLYVGLAQARVEPPYRWWAAACVAMPILWATFYAIGWVAAGFSTLDWSTSVLYASLAVIVACLMLIPPARLYHQRR